MASLDIFARKNFGRHVKTIFRIIHNYEDAEDVVQEAYLKATDNMDQYDPDRGSFNTWFNKILFSTLKDMQRKHQKELSFVDFNVELCEDENEPRFDLGREYNRRLLSITNTFHRQVLVLYYELGYSAKEIAQMLDTSVTNVTTICNRFKGKSLE